MKKINSRLNTALIAISVSATVGLANPISLHSFDPSRFRYKIDSSSVFKNRNVREAQRIDSLIEGTYTHNPMRSSAFQNPDPVLSLPPSDIMGDLEAPDGEIWSYIGKFEYLEIPPHDNVVFTERLLQEYTFTIYDSNMTIVGTVKDKIHYKNGEKRAPLCELTPVVTRNFFNTDNDIEVMVAVGINPAQVPGVHYHSYVYTLGGEKDENGYDLPIMEFNSLAGDIIEGPRSEDGSDNFYFTFSGGSSFQTRDDSSFWDRLVSRQTGLDIYGKALNDKGPRLLQRYYIPVLQLPGDQESVPPMISIRRGKDVYFLMQKYKEPFYNRYDDPINADLTQREGNSLIIDIFKATEEGIAPLSNTEIPVVLDRMPNAQGEPTSLFSYFSVGNLRYRGDVLFDAPGTSDGKPDFIITRSNYQPSSDGTVNSYFTYKNNGSLKNTLCLYSAGSRSMGDIDGFEPQQMFVQSDAFGYRYKFVDLYSARPAAEIDANYYYEEDSESEVLSANCDRTPYGDSYVYVFELRYPLIDDNENDILRFIYINPDGTYNHTDYINMGKGVAYAQSYISTDALKRNAYSISPTTAYMMLIKRGVEGSEVKIEQLMVAEAESEENPEGKTLLLLGPREDSVLTSIVPEFPEGDRQGHIFVYYYDYPKSLISLEVYGLPLNNGQDSVKEIQGIDGASISLNGDMITTEGEIRVFNTDGKLIIKGLDNVDISSLEKGVYIIISKTGTGKLAK